MKQSFVRGAALALAFAVTGTVPAGADTAFPSSIDVYPYPIIASPSKYPVTITGCGVNRVHHRLRIGFSFKNIELDPMNSVKISVDLYDTFHTFLTTVDATINGNYSPNANIVVSEFPTAGNPMPLFTAYDEWPNAASAVCYVSGVLYANGDVWKQTAPPSFDVASHALEDLRKSDPHKPVADDLAKQKALGYRETSIVPSPMHIPDGWKTASPGLYVYFHSPALHMLAFASITGAGAIGPLKPTDISLARNMEGLQVMEQHATTVCGDRHAEFLSLRGTLTTGPQIIEAIKVRGNGVSYVSSYARSIDEPPIAQAEDALSELCF